MHTTILTPIDPSSLPREECGVTRFSVQNVEAILDTGARLVAVGHYYLHATADFFTLCVFVKGDGCFSHLCSGLSAGYHGEGPHGLEAVLKHIKGCHNPSRKKMPFISAMREEVLYTFTNGVINPAQRAALDETLLDAVEGKQAFYAGAAA